MIAPRSENTNRQHHYCMLAPIDTQTKTNKRKATN